MTPELYKPILNRPIRFLTLTIEDATLREGKRLILLEPFVTARVYPNRNAAELVKDLATDILIHGSYQPPTVADDYRHYFGVDLDGLKRIAKHQALYKKDFPKRGYEVTERWLTFHPNYRGDLTVKIEETKPISSIAAPSTFVNLPSGMQWHSPNSILPW